MENAPKRNLHIPIIIGLFFLLLGFLFYLTYFRTQPTSFQAKPSATPGMTGSAGKNNLVPQSANVNKPVPGQIVVKLKQGVSEESFIQQVEARNMQVERKITAIQTYVLTVPEGQETASMQQLQQAGLVQSAENDYIQSVQMVPNDTYLKNQWGLSNTGQDILGEPGVAGKDVHAEKAWDVSQGDGVKVAVIDTGIDMSHPDLASKVVAQKVFTTNTIDDKLGHGTHVAGIVAAVTNNNQGVAGTCPGCQLLIGKALGDSGEGQASTIAESITWAADQGANIINISSGGDQDTQVQRDAIAYAISKGSLVVAAAGNDNVSSKFYPAATSGVLSVGATTNADVRSEFSNFGTWVQVTAPGTNIFSTLPTHAFNMQAESDLSTNYDYISGTSMSSPMVSGVAALVWASQYGGSADKVKQRLYDTADKITGTGQYFQYGRVNAEAAVGTVQASATPTTPVATTVPTSTANLTITDVPVSPTILPTTPLYCLGSCPTLVMSATPTLADVTPGEEESTVDPTNPDTTPGEEEPTVDPCATDEVVSAQHWGGRHHKKHNGSIGDFMEQLLELLKQLLELIGGDSNDGDDDGDDDGGTTDPCLTPTEAPSDLTPTEVAITSTEPTEEVVAEDTTPTEANVTPTTDPCEVEDASVQHWGGKHHKKHNGWIGDFMEELLELLKQLLEQLGGSDGGDDNNDDGEEEEPTEETCEPTEAPDPTEAVEEPTEGVEPTASNEEPTEVPGEDVTPTTGAGGEVETNATVKITFYGSWDNDPAGTTDIAYPVIHDEAGGTGTYEDPLTFASPAGDGAYEVGTKIYVPLVQKYFIKEDQCAVSWTAPEGCGAVTMVDLYVGNPSDAEAVVECENSLTPEGDTEIVVNPSAGLTVSSEKIWDQETGACMSPKS